MLGCFNEHFIASGLLFDSLNTSHQNHPKGNSHDHSGVSNSFSFKPLSVSEVHKALTLLDIRKSAGPDNLEPYSLQLASDFIAPPLTYLFNLSLDTN